MEIQPITSYKLNGTEYKSLKAIKTEIENKIGAIIDYSDVTLTAKQKLNLLAAIIKNKQELMFLLNITFDPDPHNMQSKHINILDTHL